MNKPSFQQDLISGAVAGGFSRTLFAPFERVKLILQVQELTKIPSSEKYKGMIDTFRSKPKKKIRIGIPRDQGFFSFWRGNGVNIARIVPNMALRFAFFGSLKNHLSQNSPLLSRVLSGTLSGMLTLICTYPLDLIRVRLSLDVAKIGETRQYNNFFDCLKKIAKNESIFGLYKGISLSLLAFVPYVSLSFTIYDTLKFNPKIREISKINEDLSEFFLSRFSFGFIAGTIAQFIVYPLDTLRRRLQMNGGPNHYKLYNNALHGFKTIYSTEGILGFYKGLVPQLIKVGPAAAVQFSTFEVCRKYAFAFNFERI